MQVLEGANARGLVAEGDSDGLAAVGLFLKGAADIKATGLSEYKAQL